MHQTLYLVLLLGLVACTTAEEVLPPSVLTVANGRVERLDSFPSRLVSARNVDIWLPATYDGKRPHQVLYMHDGQMLYDSTTTWNGQEWGVDETLGALITQEEVPPTIVVGVWNGGAERHADYFPQRPFEQLDSLFRDSLLHHYQRNAATALFATAVQSDNYLRFLVEELKPHIDSTYMTLSDQSHTFLAGSSMGGLISMYGLCEYPEVFGGAACLSTHWPGIFRVTDNPVPAAFQAYLAEHLPTPEDHKLYFDYGTSTLDAFYEPLQLQVDRMLEANGYTSTQWQTHKFPGEAHTEKAWAARLAIPLRFLLAK